MLIIRVRPQVLWAHVLVMPSDGVSEGLEWQQLDWIPQVREPSNWRHEQDALEKKKKH